MRIKTVSWDEVFSKISEVENRFLGNPISVYGVPKNGMILAGFFRKWTPVYRPEDADVILDDIIDSGRTRDFYYQNFPDKRFIALFEKEESEKDTWFIFPWENEHPARGSEVRENITRILEYIGEDIVREGLKDTPHRVVSMFSEIFSGYKADPSTLFTTFEAKTYDQIILLKDIEVFSMCEHHMLPFFGVAHVAYIPNSRLIGVSKLARLVDIYARRLQIQERIGEQVTSTLEKYLAPKGTACIIEATHMCMKMRGVSKQNSVLVTSSLTGIFKDSAETRQEFMALIKK